MAYPMYYYTDNRQESILIFQNDHISIMIENRCQNMVADDFSQESFTLVTTCELGTGWNFMSMYVWERMLYCLCVGFARHGVVKAERRGTSDDRQVL